MKTRPKTAAILLFLTLPAFADTIILKDGTKLEGKILRQDATNYYVEVSVTKSIKDERTIAKADVTKVERVKPDLVAFEQLTKLVPAPDLLTNEEYGQRVRAFEKFTTEHRDSDKLKEAKAMLAALKIEANEVLAGGVKMSGKIIPPAEYRSNAYDIDSRIQEAKIRALVKQGRYLQALRTFSDFSRDFRNTSAHAALVPLINQVINTYLAEVGETLASYDARVKERATGLTRMPSDNRTETENAIREETVAIEARFKAEQDAKIGWVTTDPFFKPSLDETVNFGKQEINRLASLEKTPAVDAGKVYREALATIQGKVDASAASNAINAAKTAMIAPRYITILETAARGSGALK